MKGFKKLLTGILAATMIFSMGITAGATDVQTQTTASIEINSKNANQNAPYDEKSAPVITYNYYEILKADILTIDKDNAKNSKVSYYVTNGKLAEALEKTNLFKVTKSASGDRWIVELANDKITGEQIAEALNTGDFKKLASATGEFTSANGVAKKDSLDPGYYLIISSLGTVAAVQTVGDVKINEKNTYPTILKEDDKDYAQMFDTVVTYTITIDVPLSVAQKPIKVVDTATKGLTFDTANESVVAKVGETEVGKYTWTADTSATDKNVYTTEIPADVVTANKGNKIVLTYTATVNENAVVLKKETNKAHLEYDNYNSADTKPVDVVTLGLRIKKVDGSDTTKTLTGAEFTLWTKKTGGEQIAVVKTAEGKYRVAKATELTTEAPKGVNIVVDANGLATVEGLDATAYYLQEEVAPVGYNKLAERKECVLNGETQITAQDVQEFSVENNSGSILPSTGGVGTTIFYTVGGCLIIAGVAFFMLRRKAQAE